MILQKEDKKLAQSLKLLRKHLSAKEYAAFITGDPISLIINHDLYTLHLIHPDYIVEIRQDGRSTPGIIHQDNLPDLYDSVVAFLANVEYAGVNWGCGKMSLSLPTTMPPRDLSLKTYISQTFERGSELYAVLKTILKVFGGVIIFPYHIGSLIAEADSTMEFTIWTFIAAGLCGLVSWVIACPPVPKGMEESIFNLTRFIYSFTYLVGLGYFGAIYSRYKKWREVWEVKKD